MGKLQGLAGEFQEEGGKDGIKSKDNRGKWIQKAMNLAEELTDDFEGDEDKKAQRKAMLSQANSMAGNIYGYDAEEEEEAAESSEDDEPIIRPTKYKNKPSDNNNNNNTSSTSSSKPPAGKPS